MFTQSHILLNAALLTRPNQTGRNIAAIAGAIIPDCDVWVMIIVEFIKRTSGCEVFHYRYQEEPWISLQALFNSFPLYFLLLTVGYFISKRTTRFHSSGSIILIFSISALLHISIDFLLHHEDARRQFWPLSDWIFRSPISYWDPNYFGNYFVIFEIFLGLFLVAILWKRFSFRFSQTVLVLLCLGYAGPIYASIFGAADHDRGPGSCEQMAQLESEISSFALRAKPE